MQVFSVAVEPKAPRRPISSRQHQRRAMRRCIPLETILRVPLFSESELKTQKFKQTMCKIRIEMCLSNAVRVNTNRDYIEIPVADWQHGKV